MNYVKDQTLDSTCMHLDSGMCHQVIKELELSVPSPSGEERMDTEIP